MSPLLTGITARRGLHHRLSPERDCGRLQGGRAPPGELSESLESIADECLIIDAELKLPGARQCPSLLAEISGSARLWLLENMGLDEIIADLRRLNPLFIVFAPKIQAGFTTRLKSEQANMRKLVIRR